MSKFRKDCDNALKFSAGTGWYGKFGRKFNADDNENIVLFAAALRTVEGIEDVEVGNPDDRGGVLVSYAPKSAIAFAIGMAISSSFKSE